MAESILKHFPILHDGTQSGYVSIIVF